MNELAHMRRIEKKDIPMSTSVSDKVCAQQLARSYITAKEFVVRRGYAAEIDWQDDVSFKNINESIFLRETAWVILSAGMREAVIRKKFSALSSVFYNWSSARMIVRRKAMCRRRALSIFRNPGKIDAIIEAAKRVAKSSFLAIRMKIRCEGVDYLRTFPFIGPVTAYHLAKNLGLDVVKADRHLSRYARAAGYESPDALCREIAKYVAEKLAVIDLVLWRYATLDPKYLRLFELPDYQLL